MSDETTDHPDHPDHPDRPRGALKLVRSTEPATTPGGDLEPAAGAGPTHIEAHPIDDVVHPMLDGPVRTMHYRAGRWTTNAARRAIYWLLHCYRDVVPIWYGTTAMARKLRWWMDGGEDGEIARAEPDAHDRRVAWDKRERVDLRVKRRRRVGLVTALYFSLMITMPVFAGTVAARAAWIISIVFYLCLADVVGRRVMREMGRDPGGIPANDAPMSRIWDKSITWSQQEQCIRDTLELRGHEVTVRESFHWDEKFGGYKITVHTVAPLDEDDIEAVGNELGADDGSVTKRRTGSVGFSQICIRMTDPVAELTTIPYYAPGSLSGWDSHVLGVSSGDVPLKLGYIGVHWAVVGITGAGKTRNVMETNLCILTACDDVEVWAADVRKVQVIERWKTLLARSATEIEDAREMLKDACAEIRRRTEILGRLSSIDSETPQDEWTPELGPAIVIMLDELQAMMVDPEIVSHVLSIARAGREVAISLQLYTQRFSADDFGGADIRSMITTLVMMASDRKEARLLDLTKEDILAGWDPFSLVPASENNGPADVAKAYIRSPFGHRSPDIYRFSGRPDAATTIRWIQERSIHRGTWSPSKGLTSEPQREDAPVIQLRPQSSTREGVPSFAAVEMLPSGKTLDPSGKTAELPRVEPPSRPRRPGDTLDIWSEPSPESWELSPGILEHVARGQGRAADSTIGAWLERALERLVKDGMDVVPVTDVVALVVDDVAAGVGREIPALERVADYDDPKNQAAQLAREIRRAGFVWQTRRSRVSRNANPVSVLSVGPLKPGTAGNGTPPDQA